MNGTDKAVNRWTSARASVGDAKAIVNSAETEMLNATNDLGKLLDPGDMKIGETICFWVPVKGRRRLLAVTKAVGPTYRVEYRGAVKDGGADADCG